MKKLFLSLLMACFSITCAAHALWIETAFAGKVGQKQEISIFYGEYAEGIKEDTTNWYSDVENFSLWLIDAKNNKTQLATTAAKDHFVASFTPTSDGVYTIFVQHPTKDFKETRYEFGASATVVVGKGNNPTSNPNTLSVSLQANTNAKINKPVTVQASFNGQVSQEVTFDVVSPMGWAKKFKADANGNLSFTPIWPGIYFIEAMHSEKKEGEFNGKAYKATWRGSTYRIEVKE